MNSCPLDIKEFDKLIGVALSNGGDYADLYFEYTTYSDLTLRDGQVGSGSFHEDYGIGVRVLCGERTGYAYSESTRPSDMLAAARAAAGIASGSGAEGGTGFRAASKKQAPGNPYPDRAQWRDTGAEKLLPVLNAAEKTIARKASGFADRGIDLMKVIVRVSASDSEIVMYNSFGELTRDTRPMASVSATAIFAKAGQTVQRSASRSYRRGPEMLLYPASGRIRHDILEALADEVCRNLEDSFSAIRPKGGRMPVVMGAGASGILLHEAMGHAFEADFARKGQSIFTDRMGRKVCASGISIVDDGTIPGNRGSMAFDDEGVPARKTYMVRDGVLESFLHDRVSAAHFGVEPTGNGRRESFRNYPIPRMRATYMESAVPGRDAVAAKPADIISSVRKGIYVDEFSNGQVKIGEGDFTFYVKSGYLIENGVLTAPVKDINIIGNGPQALADITAVGDDLKIDNGTWTCGKEQSVAVSCGMPTVLVGSLNVGGN